MRTVLIVEDDPDIRHLLQVGVERMGHLVVSTASAIQALEAIAEHGVPDVAIFDIVMREVDGLQLLRMMRAEPELAHVPAIFLTARELESDQVTAKSLGAGFLKKPIIFSALSAAIDEALTSRPEAIEEPLPPTLTVGISARWGSFDPDAPAPLHLVASIADREVLACCGTPARETRQMLLATFRGRAISGYLDSTLESMECHACQNFLAAALGNQAQFGERARLRRPRESRVPTTA